MSNRRRGATWGGPGTTPILPTRSADDRANLAGYRKIRGFTAVIDPATGRVSYQMNVRGPQPDKQDMGLRTYYRSLATMNRQLYWLYRDWIDAYNAARETARRGTGSPRPPKIRTIRALAIAELELSALAVTTRISHTALAPPIPPERTR